MDIRRGRILYGNGGEPPLSQIAEFFIPQDKVAMAFLSDNCFPCGRSLHEEDKDLPLVKEIIAVYTAPKGETLQGVLRAISAKGWRYGTIGDWYRYYIKYPLLEKEKEVIISTPGTIYSDDYFHGWIPFVSPWRNTSFLQKIVKRDKKIIAKISLKPAGNLMEFQTSRDILVSRILEEEEVFPPQKTEGPSV